jgi:hypothetical protein
LPCLDLNGFPQPSRVEETGAGFVVEINNVATYHCEDEPGRSAAATVMMAHRYANIAKLPELQCKA